MSSPVAPGCLPLPRPSFPLSAPPSSLPPLQGPAASGGVCLSPSWHCSPGREVTGRSSVSDSATLPQWVLSWPHLPWPHSRGTCPRAFSSDLPPTFPCSRLSSLSSLVTQHLLSSDPLAWSEWSGSISRAKLRISLTPPPPPLHCLCSLAKNQVISGPAEVCLRGLGL